MFPKWSDWDLQYTRKGLVKKRIRQALQVLALIAVILGIYQVGRTSDSTQDARNTIRRYAKQILFSTWDLVGRGINLVLFRMWNLAGRGNNLLRE